MKEEMSNGEKMANDDIFFSLCLAAMGIYFSIQNFNESDWLGFFGTMILALLGGLWFGLRVYHLTHKEEVFGTKENTDV